MIIIEGIKLHLFTNIVLTSQKRNLQLKQLNNAQKRINNIQKLAKERKVR